MDQFRKDTLKAHNTLREKHNAAPLQLNEELNKNAQAYAEKLIKSSVLQHSDCLLKGERIGENLAVKMSSDNRDYAGDEVTAQWYDEIKDHDFTSPDFNPNTGHFTQVVWKESKQLGVGKAKDGKGKVIVVCQYRPAGNLINTLRESCTPARK